MYTQSSSLSPSPSLLPKQTTDGPSFLDKRHVSYARKGGADWGENGALPTVGFHGVRRICHLFARPTLSSPLFVAQQLLSGQRFFFFLFLFLSFLKRNLYH